MMEGAVSQIQRHTIIRFSYLGKNRGIMWFDTEVDRINVLVKIHEVSEPKIRAHSVVLHYYCRATLLG